MIPFNIPPYLGTEDRYVIEAMKGHKLSGDGPFSRMCQDWFQRQLNCKKALMTPSCTHALEMAALLIEVKPGDEIIMPSYTFVSTANAFVLRGAKIVFVDIRPDTMNIDETLIEAAITEKTKAIVPVHYAGVSCEMNTIMKVAEKYGLFVIEDAAQAMMCSYKDKKLGSIGHMGAFSFHETKNYTSGGEGGLLIINDKQFAERAEIIREKGTNRSQFFRGMVDKYSWVDVGSSYLPSELQSAYLWAQLEQVNEINEARLASWAKYFDAFKILEEKGDIELPTIPSDVEHNAHMFYIKVKDLKVRSELIQNLRNSEISAPFHYIPLHNTQMGKKYSIFSGKDTHTTKESEIILRLPIYYGLSEKDLNKVVNTVLNFFEKSSR